MKKRKFNVRKFAEEILQEVNKTNNDYDAIESIEEKLEQIIALTELTIKSHEVNKERYYIIVQTVEI